MLRRKAQDRLEHQRRSDKQSLYCQLQRMIDFTIDVNERCSVNRSGI